MLIFRRVIPDFLQDLQDGRRVICRNPGYAMAALVWILISLMASYIPAQRAARVDPAIC
jgi:hypothetical protein